EVAGLEVSCEVGSPRVAKSAIIKDLCAGHFGYGWIFGSGFAELSLPIVMQFQRAVASFAANVHFGHGGVVGVGRFVVIAAQTGVVTGGAHIVPVHTTTGPMSPFTGLAIFFAVDVEPLVRMRIKGGFQNLKTPAG